MLCGRGWAAGEDELPRPFNDLEGEHPTNKACKTCMTKSTNAG
jgi:hypothetical protein